ncbi:hypothetical protein BS50DRAFT_608676 [Corynespora cassiicola Philippines]|uniref:Multicopper oxidase n=1 Tax=Corynespora cassiicola Philippines TaxID=1448308 RepID=A0A2T2NX59_CORCC|nr:hypothetical protein BS50DRAFT_608676 [Corynespora cassiicola Philippines]
MDRRQDIPLDDGDAPFQNREREEEEEEEEERLGLLEGDEEKRSHISDDEELAWGILVAFVLVAWTVDRHDHQPPNTAQLRPEEDYILNPEWDFDAKPTAREYHWTISEHELNPDGVFRPMMLINGMFPGPLIECNEGDEVVVHVHNQASNATSIHWHGLFQNGTNWMDGTVGITQCPIAPGHSFTYRFNVSGQTGTYWYHSHMSMQVSDGLVGPFIIHPKGEEEEKRQKVPYGQDRVVLVSDHYYDLSSSLLVQYLSPGSENDEPVPPSAVINGRNIRDCAHVPDRNCSSTDCGNALFDLSSEDNTRLRIINVGAFAEFQIQIDEHEFLLTEADGTSVWPQSIHRLNINPAQRYSIVLIPPKPANKGLYWLRARMITHCFAYENPELKEEVRGVIRYWGPGDSLTPTSKDWPEIIEVECRDLNTSSLKPVIEVPAPDTPDDTIYLRSTFQIRDWRLARGYLNDSSFRPNMTSPTLSRIASDPIFGSALQSAPPFGLNTHNFDEKRELVYQTTGIRTIDILIQNLDDGNHPFHLHGYTFFVLASGHGYAPSDFSALDLSSPLRRDTASVEAFGWLLVRFTADNPGVWAFHCHIGWHNEAGLAMVFVTRAEEVQRNESKDLG